MAENNEEQLPKILQYLGGFGGFFWGLTVGDANPEMNVWVAAIIGAIMFSVAGWVAGKILAQALKGMALMIIGALMILPALFWGVRIYLQFGG